MPQTLPLSRDLRDVLLRSGLLSKEQWSALRVTLRDDDPAADDHSLRELVETGWLTLFQAEQLREGRTRGFFFDEFRIVDLLGLGGMGWVYQATSSVGNDVVALKVLRDDLRLDPGMLARFQHEADVGMRLRHPHVVGTHSLGSAGGFPYMVMDLVRGPNLAELLGRMRQLPWQVACDFARQAALGLQHAHELLVIHRDVKPQNLLVDHSGCVRLADFGLSMLKADDAGDEFSFARIFGHDSVGTWEFAAPEQLEDSLQADARSDIYSLGATLLTLLTGRSPRELNPPSRSENRPIFAVSELVPQLQPEIVGILAKMLHPIPQQRFDAAGEVAEALSKWSRKASLDFDFDSILLQRKKSARERAAKLSSSKASRFAGSTTRPGIQSSVASAPLPRKSVPPSFDLASESSASAPPVPAAEIVCRGALASANDGNPSSPFLLRFPPADIKVPLRGDRILVGRGGDCDLHLADATVSSHHAELRRDGTRWRVVDLNSRNGTRVNGLAVTSRVLRPGDEIQFGNFPPGRLERSKAHPPLPRTTSTISSAAFLAGLAMILAATLYLVWQWLA